VLLLFWALTLLSASFFYALLHFAQSKSSAANKILKIAFSLALFLFFFQWRFWAIQYASYLVIYFFLALSMIAIIILTYKIHLKTILLFLTFLSPLLLYEVYITVKIRSVCLGIKQQDQILPNKPITKRPFILHLMFDELSLHAIIKDGKLDRLVVPNLAKLADQASWYKYAMANYPSTAPSVASMLRSKLVALKTIRSITNAISGQSLFHYLKNKGYHIEIFGQTLNYKLLAREFSDKIVVAEDLAQDGEPLRKMIYSYFRRLISEKLAVLIYDGLNPVFGKSQSPLYYADKLFEKLIDRLEHIEGENTYIYAHILLPHSPFIFNRMGKLSNGKPIFKHYLEQSSYSDLLLGNLTSTLKKRNLFNKSLIIVHSDHGLRYLFPRRKAAAPLSLQKRAKTLIDLLPQSLPEIALVPLIVKLPYQNQKSIETMSVDLRDIYPSIADFLNDIPNDLEGISFFRRSKNSKNTSTNDHKPFIFKRTRIHNKVFLKQMTEILLYNAKQNTWEPASKKRIQHLDTAETMIFNENTSEIKYILHQVQGKVRYLKSSKGNLFPLSAQVMGEIEYARPADKYINISGWCLDSKTNMPPKKILIFKGITHYFSGAPNKKKLALSQNRKNPYLLNSGFDFYLAAKDFPNLRNIRIFVLTQDDQAQEIYLRKIKK